MGRLAGVSALTVGKPTILLRMTSMAAAVVALAAGCSWIQPSNRSLAEQASQPAGTASGPSGGNDPATSAAAARAQPAWAKGLGPGIRVIAPAAAAPGHSSPGAATQGEVNAENAGKLERTCSYVPPSAQGQCRRLAATVPAGDSFPVQHFALGYVVIHGDRALVGSTGTFCASNQKPRCVTNRNPAAIFSTAKRFSVLWAESIAASNSPAFSYSLAPCVKVGHRWYIDVSFGGGA
jgi:hypothetical protein